jgi:hypothetical protein
LIRAARASDFESAAFDCGVLFSDVGSDGAFSEHPISVVATRVEMATANRLE